MTTVRAVGLSKSYRGVCVVDDVSFVAQPGTVTGLLGPNGSGKTTTLRLMTGLARGRGSTTYGGVGFDSFDRPRVHVGVSIGTAPFNVSRTGRRHLELVASASGLGGSSVRRALEHVGLESAADRQVRMYSLGMRQRLCLAAALIGDPPFVILDEPSNGLDAASVIWFENWVRRLADEGRCVVLSTHQLHEAERFVDQAVVLVAGRVVAMDSVAAILESSTEPRAVEAETDRAEELLSALEASGLAARLSGGGRISVQCADPGLVGVVALNAGIALRGLRTVGPTLEEVFADLCASHPAPHR